jgi:hypothetical protein
MKIARRPPQSTSNSNASQQRIARENGSFDGCAGAFVIVQNPARWFDVRCRLARELSRHPQTGLWQRSSRSSRCAQD